jgi:hypothetical protein
LITRKEIKPTTANTVPPTNKLADKLLGLGLLFSSE